MGAGETSLPEFAMTLLRPALRAIAPHCHAGAIALVWTEWRACPKCWMRRGASSRS